MKKTTALLIFICIMSWLLCNSQQAPVQEKKYTVTFTKSEWQMILQQFANSDIPSRSALPIIQAINAQLEAQDTVRVKKEKK